MDSQYTSKEYDEETGLYYMNARYMNPVTSRWVSSDPSGWQLINPMEQDRDGNFKKRRGFKIIESMNPYSYTAYNPVKYLDPTGNDSVSYVDFDFADRHSNLSSAQRSLMNDPDYMRGAGGPEHRTDVTPRTTWCNQATYALAKKMGFSLDNFRSEPGQNLGIVRANDAAKALKINSQKIGSTLKSINAEMAGILAELGYTVIAASENPGGIGHIATVSTNQVGAESSSDPLIANVGWNNGNIPASEAFHGRDVEYYIDTSQKVSDIKKDYEVGSEVVR